LTLLTNLIATLIGRLHSLTTMGFDWFIENCSMSFWLNFWRLFDSYLSRSKEPIWRIEHDKERKKEWNKQTNKRTNKQTNKQTNTTKKGSRILRNQKKRLAADLSKKNSLFENVFVCELFCPKNLCYVGVEIVENAGA